MEFSKGAPFINATNNIIGGPGEFDATNGMILPPREKTRLEHWKNSFFH
jgi:hypothetical protein